MKIFNFADYKHFLWYFIELQPKKGRGQVKAISECLEIDPSQVSQVLSGSKEFTEEQALLIAGYAGLNELETDYFLTLIKIERAGSKTLKDYYIKKCEKLKESSLNIKERFNQDRILTDFDKSIFYSSYLYSAVRLSTAIGLGQTISEIADRFEIPRQRATAIMSFLTETKLCEEKDGKYILGTQHTHVERGSPFLSRHHQNWRVKALEKMDSISDQELQFTGPASISKEDFHAIRELLVESVSKFVDKAKKSEASDVACLLIDWFWLNK